MTFTTVVDVILEASALASLIFSVYFNAHSDPQMATQDLLWALIFNVVLIRRHVNAGKDSATIQIDEKATQVYLRHSAPRGDLT